MTDHHPVVDIDRDLVVFSLIPGEFCSVCAPKSLPQAEVEAAMKKHQPPSQGEWRALDLAMLRAGAPTPNQCNEYSQRQHWFLVGPSYWFLLPEQAN